MSEAGMAPVAQRAAAALARTDGFSVPLEPEGHTGTRGPELDALVGELEDLLAESTAEPGEEATAAVVGARLGRCRAARFLLEGDPADRERALALLEEARSSALLGEEEREAAYRSLVALAGSRLVRLSQQVMTGLSGQWTVDRLMSLAALGTPLAGGGSGLVEDSALLVRLLLERDHPQMTPRLREDLRVFGEMTEAHLAGDHEGLLRGGRYAAATMADREVPPSVSTLMTLALDQIERPRGEAAAEAEETRDARAGDTVEPEEVRGVMSRFLALAEVMAPGMMGPDGLSELLAEMSGPGGAEGEERHSLPSRMVAALLHVALAFRTGDMQGFREALRLMHEASANGELDGRAQTEWLQAVVPAVLHGAALTGGSLQDEDMAQYLVEAYHWEDDPTSVNAANLRVCAESVRLLGRLTSALDRHDVEAIDDVIDALCELELDETCAGAEEWTAMLSTFVLGLAYLGRVVHGTNGSDRTTDLRAAVHHLQWVTEMSVDMPVMRSILDIACAPLITLTAIVESDPGRIAEGVRRARSALDGVAFTSEFRPRARGGIAIALDTLHQLTGDTGALDEAIDELTRARAELPDGGPGGAGLTWDLAALRAKRALLRPDPTGTAVDAVTPDAVAELRAAVGLARTSLRSSAEDVLLQQGVGRGLRIARAAADRGRTAAFWALRAGLPEEAIACLEAGRSLVLGAAAVSAGVADRLAALGESELAERWRTAAAGDDAERGEDRSLGELSAAASTGGTPGDLRGPLELLAAAGMGAPDLPGDLRRRSLEVLRGQGGADVQPQLATVTDLRAGLRATGADALLYLVPGVDDPDGAVLVVTADGPVTALALPGLAPDGRGPVARYLAAGADRQRREAADDGTGDPQERKDAVHRWQQALDGLCVWAGEVLGPALDDLRVWDRALAEAGLTDAPAAAPDAVRLVIVPCGDLGVVPWQAAVLRPPVARGAPRAVRACEIAVLTHAASGREFLRAAARRRMAPADRPALVFHGADDLPWAEEEIDTLAAVHYRHAVVHRPDEDPATPGTVLDLLGGRAAAPASLVHLACHGLAGPDPTRSALRLAAPGGAGEPSGTGGDLTLSALLETPAEGDAFRATGPLVVCGGCETDLTTRDHDEALTLTSVLVHRLAADAIGSRWKVDDMRSELLMLVLHDALDRGLAPPDALRAAQRWMLTPPAARPPVRALKDIAAPWRLAEDLRDRPDTWAAFVHHGNPAPAAAAARRQEGDGA